MLASGNSSFMSWAAMHALWYVVDRALEKLMLTMSLPSARMGRMAS